jgi:glutamate dehydrogenase (NAD(P)+)
VSAVLRVFADSADSKLDAFVVVDSLVGGQAMGGTRMTAGVDPDEVAGLARKMTLKLALANVAIGGAKAGIRSDLPAGAERDRQLADFGRMVQPLLHGGIYLGTDQGVTYRDRELFFRTAGFEVSSRPGVSLPLTWSELWRRCEDVTGFGVCEGIRAAAAALGWRAGSRTAAIQGFGAVGRPVARMLERSGYRVTAVADRLGTIADPSGLPVEDLLDRTDAGGTIDRRGMAPEALVHTAADAWLDVDADLLVLAAGGDAVNEGNVDRVRASVVVEAGNLACSPAAHQRLAERDVSVLPDIVLNCGGATVTGLVLTAANPAGLSGDQLVSWLYAEVAARIRANVSALFERVEAGRPLAWAADRLAEERLALRDGAGGTARATGAHARALA